MANRQTHQKEIIHRSLCEMRCHPTAGEVYARIHALYPTVSRSTVYRVLSRMAEEGKILRLDLGGSDSRYDGDITPHTHVQCRICGTIADLPAVHVPLPASRAGFLVEDAAVIYHGLCPSCRRERPEHSASGRNEPK